MDKFQPVDAAEAGLLRFQVDADHSSGRRTKLALSQCVIGIVVRPDCFFMYHDLLNQLVEDIGCQLCDAGIFPDEGQEPLDILVDLIALGDLRRQLLPLSLKLRLFSFRPFSP